MTDGEVIEVLTKALSISLKYLYKAKADGMETTVPVSRAIQIVEDAIRLSNLAKQGRV